MYLTKVSQITSFGTCHFPAHTCFLRQKIFLYILDVSIIAAQKHCNLDVTSQKYRSHMPLASNPAISFNIIYFLLL